MIIKNGLVFGEDERFALRELYIDAGRIVASPEEVTDTAVLDASGLYVIPGLIDVHSHGAVGCDFSDADPEGLRKILRYQRSCGITSYCPTSMTLPKEELISIFKTFLQAGDSPDQARPVGINMEGPFLAAKKKGAHVASHIIEPDIDFFRECNEASGGNIRLVTLAPNSGRAMEFIRELHDETTISLGHTTADYDTSRAAMEAGARHVTHLYNAMMPFGHRDPGLVGAAADDPQCMVELIADGIHVHESVVRSTFRLFRSRVVLISDSMRAVGLSDGVYTLGGQEVTVKGRLATLSGGTIAGSATNLYDCMRSAVSMGIPLEEAVAAATCNPARSIRIFDKVGSLAPGKRADVLLVDKDLNLVRVI